MNAVIVSLALDHLLSMLWTIVGWGFVGLLGTIALYFVVRRLGGFAIGVPAEQWIRRAIFVVWLFLLPVALINLGVTLKAETIVADQISGQTGAAARTITEAYGGPAIALALAAAGGHAGAGMRGDFDTRVSLDSLKQLKSDILKIFEEKKDELLSTVTVDDSIESSFRGWAVGSAYDYLFEREVGARLVLADNFLGALEPHKAKDGTIDLNDIADVVAVAYLEPHVQSFVGSLFGSTRTPIYLFLVFVIAIPVVICRVFARLFRSHASA